MYMCTYVYVDLCKYVCMQNSFYVYLYICIHVYMWYLCVYETGKLSLTLHLDGISTNVAHCVGELAAHAALWLEPGRLHLQGLRDEVVVVIDVACRRLLLNLRAGTGSSATLFRLFLRPDILENKHGKAQGALTHRHVHLQRHAIRV